MTDEFRREKNLVPLVLLGQLAAQAEGWRAKLLQLKDQFKDLKCQTQMHKGSLESITAALSALSQCIHDAIMVKQNQESEAYKKWEEVEEQRSEANRARNQVLIAGGLVALLGNQQLGLSIAYKAITIQQQYEGYKERRTELGLTIQEFKQAQAVRHQSYHRTIISAMCMYNVRTYFKLTPANAI